MTCLSSAPGLTESPLWPWPVYLHPSSVYIVSWTNPSASVKPFGMIPLWTRIHRGGKQTGLLDLQTEFGQDTATTPNPPTTVLKITSTSSHWPDRLGLWGSIISLQCSTASKDTHVLCLHARKLHHDHQQWNHFINFVRKEFKCARSTAAMVAHKMTLVAGTS